MPRKPEDADVEFATSTSLHGVQHLVEQRPLVYKIVWGILIIGATALCVWQINDRVTAYFKYQTSYEYNEITPENMIFPTVTFCSSYRSRDDLLTENDKIILQLNDGIKKHVENFEFWTHEKIENFNTDYGINYKKQANPNLTEVLLKNSYKLTNDTLLFCLFNNKYCHSNDFFFVFSLNYELCWAFNSHLSVKTPLNQYDPRPDFGLISFIDLQMDKHTIAFQTSFLSQFNLYLSPHGEIPLGFNDAIPIAPGVVTHIKLDYAKYEHLTNPYGNCNPNKNLPPYGRNTLQNCLAQCYIEYYKHHAGCQPFIYSGFYSNPGNYCDFIDYFLTFTDIETKYGEISGKICGFCTSSCTEIKYSSTVYYTEPWHNAGIQNLMKSRNVTADYIKRNYLILNIFFDTFVYDVVQEMAVMTVSSLLSDIGGALGLFLGVSILTIVEIVTYLVRRFKLTLINCKRGRTIEG